MNAAEKKWVKIYPIYFDKSLKISEGRKVGIKYSVEEPTSKLIYQVCNNLLKLTCKVEDVYLY